MEVRFDINRIIKIRIDFERQSNRFVFVNAKPIKTWFGLVDTGKKTQEGFADSDSWCNEKIYTWEELTASNYRVNMEDKTVFVKPDVTIYLEDDNKVTRVFDTDALASQWVDALEKLATGKFETVIYK